MSKNKIMRFVVIAVALTALMTLTAFAEIKGGFGAIGGVDETYYAAPATLNSKGDGLALGEVFQLTDANNTGLAGLYAVSTDSTFESDYEIVYVYGAYADRKAITERTEYLTYSTSTFLTVTASSVDTDSDGKHDKYGNTLVSDGTSTYVVAIDENNDGLDDNYSGAALSDKYTYGVKTINEVEYNLLYKNPIQQVNILEKTEIFVPGYFTGKGGWTNYVWGTWSGYPYAIGQTGSQMSKASQNAYAEATTIEAKEEALATIIKGTKDYNLSYALTEKEIVKISEINEYKYSIEKRVGSYVNKNHVIKFDAYIADKNGTITVYYYLHDGITLGDGTAELTVDFENGVWKKDNVSVELPAEGYLVGFRIWPYYGINNITDFSATTTTSAGDVRFYHRASTESGYYSIDTPKVAKPTGLEIDEDGKLQGTIPGMAYEYANLNDTARLKEFAENGAVTTALTYTAIEPDTVIGAGLYAIRAMGVEGEYESSDAVVVYVKGDSTNNIMHYDDAGLVLDDGSIYSSGGWRTANKNRDVRVFNKGVWSGALYPQTTYKYVSDYQHNLFNSGDNNLVNWAAQQYYNGPEGTNTDTSNGIDYATFVHAVESEYTTYQYEDDEIIPFSDFASYTYKTNAFRTQITADGDVYTKFIFYVVTEDGSLEAREWTQVMDFNGALQEHTVKGSDFSKSTGYIVAMEIHPTGYVPKTTTLSGSDASDRTSYCITLVPNGYVLKTAQETPEITVSNNIITVANFVEGVTYSYSIDDGKTWTNFTTESVTLTRALVYPKVKALADDTHFESEIATSEVSTNGVVFKGASIVLDGQIGLRFYFDVATENVSTWTQWKFSVEDKNTGKQVMPITTYRFSRTSQSGWNVADFVDDRTAYVTVYVAPKDFDNFYVKTSAFYWYTSGTSNLTNITGTMPSGSSYNIASYIEAFYEQVEAGNAECVAANELVMALEAYCKNADNYFSDAEALDAVVADTSKIDLVEAPAKSGKFTYNNETIFEHYSTSLILEENVTIRHYFKATAVVGQPTLTSENVTATEESGKAVAFNPANFKESTVDGQGYYYVDITDIDAKNLGTQYTLTLTLGEETISVKYSALNYVKQAYGDSNTKLANLAKAIFNYSVEAQKFVTAK